MNHDRLSEYTVMWILVFFDLPTDSAKAKRDYMQFRKNLLRDGFIMFQFSIYVRHCASKENMEVHLKRVHSIVPDVGSVGILTITDKQFANIQILQGKKAVSVEPQYVQLEIF